MADMDSKVRAAIAMAAMSRGNFSGNHLEITQPHDHETYVALVAALTDVQITEWDGPESGTQYRSYRGQLPSGLRLDIITDRELIPLIEQS